MPESNTPSNKQSDEPPSGPVVEIVNRQGRHVIDEARLCEAARIILDEAGCPEAHLSLAVVDDAEMHQLNRQYLEHDYPTDVLSFLLDESEHGLEGEIIVSADTACREAANYQWRLDDELLLYVIHGTLHLVGFDDHSPHDRQQMREQESQYLKRFGLVHRYDQQEVEPPPESLDAQGPPPAPGAAS